MATLGLVSSLSPVRQPDVATFDFSKMSAMDSRLTFTGGAGRTYYGPGRVMQRAAVNEPRFETGPAGSRYLRLDPAATNLITQSETLMGGSAATIGPLKVVGGVNVWRVTPTAVSGVHYADRTISLQPEGTPLSFQWAVRRAGYNFVRLSVYGGATTPVVEGVLNLITGVITGKTGQAEATLSVDPLADGLWLVKAEGVVSVAGTTLPRFRLTFSDTGASSTVTGDGIKGIDIGGGQAEIGPVCTSYIPTQASAVTRETESCRLQGTPFTDAYNAAAYTIIADLALMFMPMSSLSLFLLSSGFSSNMAQLRTLVSGNGISGRAQVSAGGYVNFPSLASSPWVPDVRKIVALRALAGRYQVSVSGASSAQTAVIGTPVNINSLGLGAGTNNEMPMRYYSLRMYKVALTNAEIAGLTVS